MNRADTIALMAASIWSGMLLHDPSAEGTWDWDHVDAVEQATKLYELTHPPVDAAD